MIFDLGNVLVDFDHVLAARRIAPFCKKTPQEAFSLFFDSGITALFEEGRISPREFFLRIKKMLGAKLDYRAFLPIWNEIFFFTEKNHAVYNLARSLKKRYRVALLSNVNILHFKYIRERFEIFDAFHHTIPSFEAGARKPDRRIYQKALTILDVLPQEAFYTDDRADLIRQARRLGLRAYVFKDIRKLTRDLEASGIRIN